MAQDKLCLLGFASGVGGVDSHTGDGPLVIQQSSFVKSPDEYQWAAMIHAAHSKSLPIVDKVSQACTELAKAVSVLTQKQKRFCVIGGDHSSAIGTFSGVYHALHQKGDIGLIWIDAHMDSHTPETSLTGRIHGMPLACLFGYGYPALTSIMESAPKIKPENVCLVGIRSFENGESELLERLNVKIYFVEEVQERGIATVLHEAVKHVSANTIAYGISLDMDVIDPSESPGVDVPELNGIDSEKLTKALASIVHDKKLVGMELAEFNPARDRLRMTEKLMIQFLEIMNGKKV